ncbi:MAG TPA: inorganic diphosphatase, partial [Ardenticatenaceae bacterium]|nr:inorganic diphosphatase [Ardenticatenaceae bacterium]
IAVTTESRNHRDVHELDQLNENLVAEIEHFFVSYNAVKGKKFEPRGRFGSERARMVVEEGIERYEQQ